jgi:hypothetical protein
MNKNVILIDYENVQNVDLKPLIAQDVLILVFHNKNQKFSSSLLHLALEFGKEKFLPVEIAGSGKNAVDFHIAYFIGKLSKELEKPSFHIISKDTGFKPLAQYLNNSEKILCLQENSISDIQFLKSVVAPIRSDYYQKVVDYLEINAAQSDYVCM